uniref:Uncharacterized protein n=1 Tax=Grammatophora oceanica TaxID=210454 RepID=A0A6U5NS36_9STRA|mmetsp:Transcript_45692/g.67937  ORF Transcript_45692/g.67937 Transcript_45692/m.67937 type:complete len:735 (+) Transcript_45692:807-3011(+)|eukprot:CAMPEP_0194035240 /NCGR_PEP_ID=MMETSP0009_2-20130614/7682_1 /TAXON_ID=210454 /ORGANISM="Grammatophora oceanica, Strain CCMP 410" /LENGTH=734 /DNA_ID=CAMNT_0038676513 /DNA_START=837 /DNA_END=3041 /DNA_ORIENTATION=-
MPHSENYAHDIRDTYRGPDLRIFIRDVRDRQGKKRPVSIKSWSTVQDVKNQLQQLLHVPPSSQRLYFGPLMGNELPNHRTLHDAGIYHSGETLLLDIANSTGMETSSTLSQPSDVCVSKSWLSTTPRALRQKIQQARRGMALGLKPELVLDGSGGTYFLRDARKCPVAVFKPADEEPYASNNPRGYVRQATSDLSLREGVEPGELCLREVAAYLLDHGGYSGVPMTTLAEARHVAFHCNGENLNCSQGGAAIGPHHLGASSSPPKPIPKKAGSLQEYVNAECTMDDMGTGKVSTDEIHKIAILDIRIMNADRNAANLLCRRRPDNTIELVPIDHGFCLRAKCDVAWYDWCWLDWPQLKQPLSKRSRKYVLNLDIDKDARMLKERLNISEEALGYFRASSKLLQEGVKAGLSLYEIASMCCRNDNMGEHPSKLEQLTAMAQELATSAVENGRWHHSAASRALVDQLTPTAVDDRRLLLLGSERGSSTRLIKSASSANFSLSDGLSIGSTPVNVPGMMQSSGSDSGSEEDDGVTSAGDAMDEWAATIIADVSLDQSMGVQNRRGSPLTGVGSDDGSVLSSSPQGFWHRSPAGFLGDDSDQDDDSTSVIWSPNVSPASHPDVQSDSISKRISFAVPPPDFGNDSAYQSPTFQFAEQPSSFLLPPPATVDVATVKATSTSTMSRSRSYSALSSADRANSMMSQVSSKVGGDVWTNYLQKFVDLVIARETTAAAATTLD